MSALPPVPVVLAQVLGDAVDRVGRGDVERQRGAADLRRRLGQRLGGLFDVDQHDLRAVAGEHLGDLGADAPRGTGDQRDLAVERLVPVGGRHRVGGADVEHLAVDVGGLGRQQEAHGGLQPGGGGLGVGGQVDQADRRAALQLLAERAGEALERALGDPLVDAARSRRAWCR